MIRLLALALLLAAPAQAGDLELRHGPPDPGCSKESPQAEANAHKWTGALGGPRTAKAWKILLKSGPHGCDAVATWLDQGAPAGSDEEVAGAVQGLLRAGSPANVTAAAAFLGSESHQIVAAAAFGLRARLPVADRSLAELLVAASYRPWEPADDAPDPHASVLGILVGRHAEGRVQFVQDGPVSVPEWVDTATWSADTLPELHLEALTALMGEANAATERAFATLALSAFDEELPVAPPLGPLLVPLLTRVGSEGPTAQIAAQALGRGQPEGIDPAVEAVVQQRNPPWLAPHLLNGFEDRIKAGPVDQALVDRLDALRAVLFPRAARRAERLWKRAALKLKAAG